MRSPSGTCFPPPGSAADSWPLRLMAEADVPRVSTIEAVSFSDPWSSRMFAQELLADLSWHVVASDSNGEVVGFLIGRQFPDEWHLMDLAVAPSCRRRGVARRLLTAFLEAADAARSSVVLEVRPSNIEAQLLYAAYGFETIGRRRQYYSNGAEDALIMQRPWQPPAGVAASPTHRGPQVPAGVGADAPPPAQPRDAHMHTVGAAACVSGPILALETSCDDSSAAVLSAQGEVLSSVVHSQDAIHERYGGVVPEVASRAHVERMSAVVREALRQAEVELDGLAGVAATVGPGLIGALLVGVQTAKAIAWSRRLPFFPVNHLHGHLAAVWLGDQAAPFPMVTLVASGGHTSLIRVDDRSTFTLLGQTLDDAAGEAFDKGARLLGLGYPGGRELDQLAESGDSSEFSFPIGLRRSARPDFSFSGVKTALYYLLRDMAEDERRRRAADIAASYREAIVTALVEKTVPTALAQGARTVAVAGGVAANSLLRRRLQSEGGAAGLHVVVPPFAYCTDNAAMIGAAALSGPLLDYPHYLDIDATASLPLGRWLP